MSHCEVPGPARGRRRRLLGRGSLCVSLAAYAGFWLPPWPHTLPVRSLEQLRSLQAARPFQSARSVEAARSVDNSAPTPVMTRALSQSMSPYWLLVTFASTDTPQSLATFATSSFNGVAVPVDSAYYTGQTPALTTLEPLFAQLHAAAQRDIWPWVFINRMVSASGLDLSPAGNAQGQFLDDWRAALTLARTMQSPGVVLDLEFYNDPGIAYAMTRFAQAQGVAAQDASQLLQDLGKTLADIAQQTYPAAQIWILNSALNTSQDQQIDGQNYYEPRGEIAIGLLQELAALNSRVAMIDGGEDSLGYCHADLAALQSQTVLRQQQYASTLNQYGSWLSLSGTIAVWTAASSKTSWLTQEDCGMSEVWGIAGFTDYFSLLDGTYRYNWVYGAQAGGYDPSNSTTASQLTAALEQASLDARSSAAPVSPPRRAHRGGLVSTSRALPP